MLLYFMFMWSILRHLVYFIAIWFFILYLVFFRFGVFYLATLVLTTFWTSQKKTCFYENSDIGELLLLNNRRVPSYTWYFLKILCIWPRLFLLKEPDNPYSFWSATWKLGQMLWFFNNIFAKKFWKNIGDFDSKYCYFMPELTTTLLFLKITKLLTKMIKITKNNDLSGQIGRIGIRFTWAVFESNIFKNIF
jgi:hypothetical protein